MNRTQIEHYHTRGYSDEMKQHLGNELKGSFLLQGLQRADWLG